MMGSALMVAGNREIEYILCNFSTKFDESIIVYDKQYNLVTLFTYSAHSPGLSDSIFLSRSALPMAPATHDNATELSEPREISHLVQLQVVLFHENGVQILLLVKDPFVPTINNKSSWDTRLQP